ncbi:MAG: exopolysaccharide biosynthesis polyprenyl glycosylphosphotransferase [Clostridia bacterium]|nr:exopolysaccharide biosynthesis polyprenyl glycosylphosphotransferase [Clostridia bacterium]
MNDQYKKQLCISGIKLLHYAAAIALFYLFWMLFRYGALLGVEDVGFRYNFYVAAGYAACLLFFSRTYNAYLLGYTRIRMLVFLQFLAQFFSVLIVYGVVSVAWNVWKAPFWFLPMLVLDGLLDIAWSRWGNGLYFKLYPTKKTILIYRSEQDRSRLGNLRGKPTERLYQITKELQYDDSFHDLKPLLAGYDAVFVAGVNSKCRNGILKYCKEQGIPGFFLPHVGDVIMQEAVHVQAFDAPVLYVARSELKPEYRIAKRFFDIAASLIGIVFLSHVMLAIALAVRFCDGGSALYKQVRLTRNGKRFQILKFRSMRVDAEKDGPRLSSGKDDARVTPVGRVIRMCRLDELPQLFNILAGDMSFVGPRPERPEIAEEYEKTIPDFKLRLQVKAGLTGYAQVYGKYNTDPYEKLQFDLLYINNMGILTDLKLLFATAAILFLEESTEGIEQGAIGKRKEFKPKRTLGNRE